MLRVVETPTKANEEPRATLDEVLQRGALMMAFKLLAMADERRRKVNGSELLPLVRAGVQFVDGVPEKSTRVAGNAKENAA